MKDHIRSLIILLFLLIVSALHIMMNSYKAAIFSGVLVVLWLGKGFGEWLHQKK